MIWLGDLLQEPARVGPFSLPGHREIPGWWYHLHVPTPWKRPLETACSAIMTQENNAEMEGAREWTSRGMTRKIPSDGIVTGRQTSLLYPPRSMGCAQQVEFIMQRLGDLAFNHSPREKKNLNVAWDFIWVVLRHSVGSGGEVGVRPVQIPWEEGKQQKRAVAVGSPPLV